MTALPSLKFDTSDFVEEDRFDVVVDMWRPYLSFNNTPRAASKFLVQSQFWWLGELSFQHSISSPTNYFANIVRDDEPLIAILYLSKGRRNYSLGDELKHQSPDSVHIVSSRQRSLWNSLEDEDAVGLYVPLIRLGILPGQSFRSRTFSTDEPVGGLLRSMLLSLSETLSQCKREDGLVLADGICAFLQPILRDVPDITSEDVRQVRRHAIQRHIEENIRDHSLNADQLCQKFNISRASLYRLFKDEDGINSFITKRRVKIIQSELLKSAPRWGLIRAVAEKYGYEDMAHFHRTFRRIVGAPAGDFTGQLVLDVDASKKIISDRKELIKTGITGLGKFVDAVRNPSL